MTEEIHQYDIGTDIEVTVRDGASAVDISAATAKYLNFYKPSGGSVAKSATLSSDGTNGKMKYTTVSGDLDEVGIWKLQAYLELGAWKGHSSTVSFEVFENIA